MVMAMLMPCSKMLFSIESMGLEDLVLKREIMLRLLEEKTARNMLTMKNK